MRAITYRRVSTREQGDSGLGLQAQATALKAAIAAKGWAVVEDLHDVASGKTTNGRKGLEKALEMLDSGKADVLVVSKLDRLSRSMSEFANLLERARRKKWAVVALDIDIDTTSPQGELFAHMMAALAQWERRVIGERTKDGLAAAKARGTRLGARRTVPNPVRERIVAMRADGATLQAIADMLTNDGVPTGRGGPRWYPSTVRSILKAERKRRLPN